MGFDHSGDPKLSGDKELVGTCSVAGFSVIDKFSDLTVLLQPVHCIYRPQVEQAWKATGFVKLQKVVFPPSSRFDVNMMPFRMGDKASQHRFQRSSGATGP